MLHLVGRLYYLYQWCTVKQISDNEIYLLIKYIKSVLWRVAKCLAYIEEARCLKVNWKITWWFPSWDPWTRAASLHRCWHPPWNETQQRDPFQTRRDNRHPHVPFVFWFTNRQMVLHFTCLKGRCGNSLICCFVCLATCPQRGLERVLSSASSSRFQYVLVSLSFRHRASCILGQAFHYSPENALCVFNQQIYFIIWYLLDRASLI